MTKPTLTYFDLHGRGACIKATLECSGTEYKDVKMNFADWPAFKQEHAGKEILPYGQLPAYSTSKGQHLTGQSVIMRHIARRRDMYGSTDSQIDKIEVIMEGVESLRMKYVGMIYGHPDPKSEWDDERVASFVKDHVDSSSSHGSNGGAHVKYLARFASGKEYLVGEKLTIADILMADIMFLIMRVPGVKAQVESEYPKLSQWYDWLLDAQPKLKAVFDRSENGKINGTPLG
eukprot:GHVH01001752.1.p1 GENE.GHVH01001752.1~~GHVH01001752.1.p1  ORF type:complete len:232 (+),score=27.59 GHVH01001752.1:56-751(+)